MFNENDWEFDLVKGHPDSVDFVRKIDDNFVVTGCGDGIIRMIGIKPNKFIGVVGVHPEGFPIERLCVGMNGQKVVSTDCVVKIWDLTEEGSDGFDEMNEMMESSDDSSLSDIEMEDVNKNEAKTNDKKSKTLKNQNSKSFEPRNSFFDEMD